MTIFIRPAKSSDSRLVFDLIAELARYERLTQDVDATVDALATALFCENPRVFCEIGECDGEPAGLAIWFYSFSTFRGRHGIWLEDLFVRPTFRCRGIGKALLAGLAGRCRDEDLARLEWSVLDWNEPSIRFYKNIGARLMEEWTHCRIDGDALLALGRAHLSSA